MILSRIVREVPPASWEALWEACEASRILELMPFGKHKDVSIKDLPADYVRKALEASDRQAE